jgi:glycosyltransferase involved in cell wall biosynthesis
VNVERLAERMSELYHRPELVATMHEQAKELAKALTWETLRPRYEEVIEKAIDIVKSKQ